MKKIGWKIISAAALCGMVISFSTASSSTSVLSTEKAMAGITLSFDKYCEAVLEEVSEDTAEATQTPETDTKEEKTTVKSNKASKTSSDAEEEDDFKLNLKYSRLGIANVDTYLNVRKKPSEGSKIVGKMTKNSGCHIYKIKNGWAKIVSGKVNGWVKAKFLIKDEAAEKKARKVATLRAIVTTETLNVRFLPTTDSRIYDQLAEDEEYEVEKENLTVKWLKKYVAKHCKKKDLKEVDLDAMYADIDNWMLLSIDNEKMFVSKDFVTTVYNLNRAVTIQQASSGGSSSGSGSSGSSSVSSSIVNFAMQYLGNRYVYGGTSLTGGTDCSGFVMRIYQHFGYSLPRTSSAQAAATTTVSSPQVGDLFFYGNGSGSVSHVALYIGNGQIIHASNARDGIKISNAYYRTPVKIGRVMN